MRIFYTDGSCSPNPGPGGWSVVEDKEAIALGHAKESTNIRMEGEALIAAMTKTFFFNIPKAAAAFTTVVVFPTPPF